LPHHAGFISKARLDALADAMFGVAMTLLVIDIRLPEDFKPTSGAALLDAVLELRSKFLVYIITFFVVGLRWFGTARLAADRETVSSQFALWTLLHLFLITCMPFSTMMVGRYDAFPLATWIYAANMIFGALVAMRLITIAAHDSGRTVGPDDGIASLWLLVASAALSVAISFYDPALAMSAYLLNVARSWVSPKRSNPSLEKPQ
jgi:uncharacterized membrane protein